MGRVLGEDLFDPPGVEGFAQNREWISGDTLLLRQTLMRKTARKIASSGTLESLGPEEIRRWLLPVDPAVTPRSVSTRRRLEAILTDPAYQLK
jgi:uncharacterized protein (DUF1800 family)